MARGVVLRSALLLLLLRSPSASYSFPLLSPDATVKAIPFVFLSFLAPLHTFVPYAERLTRSITLRRGTTRSLSFSPPLSLAQLVFPAARRVGAYTPSFLES